MKKMFVMSLLALTCASAIASNDGIRERDLLGKWHCQTAYGNDEMSMKTEYMVVINPDYSYRMTDNYLLISKGKTHFGYAYDEDGTWQLVEEKWFFENPSARMMHDKQPSHHVESADKAWYERVSGAMMAQMQKTEGINRYVISHLSRDRWEMQMPNAVRWSCQRKA